MILTYFLLSLTSFNDFLIFIAKKKKILQIGNTAETSMPGSNEGILSYFLYVTEANLKREKSSKPVCNHCMF